MFPLQFLAGAMKKSDSMGDTATPDAETVREILSALKDLRYGSLEITIQDGKVVQLERKEKRRLKSDEAKTP
jgi:hypothetical protein